MELFGLKDKEGREYKLQVESYRDGFTISAVYPIDPQPEFKVGDWICLKKEPLLPDARMGRIIALPTADQTALRKSVSYDRQYLVSLQVPELSEKELFYERPESLRLMTPQEIESHLRKICNEKYIGKKVKCLHCDEWCNVNNWSDIGFYQSKDDVFRYGDVVVYMDGKFAEIIPDKKPLPKNIEELIHLLYDFRIFNKEEQHTVREFIIKQNFDYED